MPVLAFRLITKPHAHVELNAKTGMRLKKTLWSPPTPHTVCSEGKSRKRDAGSVLKPPGWRVRNPPAIHGLPDAGWRSSRGRHQGRSEEHTSELQSQSNLVCR